jgi:hypothetical protein
MKKITIIAGFILAISFLGCKKETTETKDTDQISFRDQAYADATFEEVSHIADDAYNNNGQMSIYKSGESNYEVLSGCATVTIDTSSNPKKITINFGSTNCLCQDGRQRRGKIIVSFTGKYKQAGTVITHTFDNYYVNDNKIEGSRVVTNQGLNSYGQIYYSVVVNGTIALADNEGVITYQSNRVRTWLVGYNTQTLLDDTYGIDGTGNLTASNGIQVTFQTLTQLVKKLTCRRLVQGQLKITRTSKPDATIDFGNGTCDDIATVTVNGISRTVFLR